MKYFEVWKSMAEVVGIEPAISVMLLLHPDVSKSHQALEQFSKELYDNGIVIEDSDIPNIAKGMVDLIDTLEVLAVTKSKSSKKKKVRNTPVSELKWVHRPKERKELKKEGKVRFLGKNKKGEPCCPYTNKDGTINCRMVHAAEVRAAQNGYKEAAAKAKRIYQRECKKTENKKKD